MSTDDLQNRLCHSSVKSNRPALPTNNVTMGVLVFGQLGSTAVSFLIKEILNQLLISWVVVGNYCGANQAFLLLHKCCPRLGQS